MLLPLASKECRLIMTKDFRNKLASGREQDLLDVKVLRAAEKAVGSGKTNRLPDRKG